LAYKKKVPSIGGAKAETVGAERRIRDVWKAGGRHGFVWNTEEAYGFGRKAGGRHGFGRERTFGGGGRGRRGEKSGKAESFGNEGRGSQG
jgi:hypothetical protein